MTVTAQYAQEHLPELLDSVERGEEIEVTSDGKPSIRLLVRPPTPTEPIILGAVRRTRNLSSEQGGTSLGEPSVQDGAPSSRPLMQNGIASSRKTQRACSTYPS